MTFEEFFTKKKIDLKALKAADEPLFEEFRAHYSAMGEKSFDHSKKFWFNKLRKSYHLAEEAVVIKKPIQTDPVETAPTATDTTAAKPAGFKPRFKAAAPADPSNQKEEPKTEPSTTPSEATDSEGTETPKPAGFKPRFKPGITKNTATIAEETSAPTDLSNDTAPETAKPTGFKPRFKPGVTKAADSTVNEGTSSPAEASDSSATEAPKPTGFKPRFKAGLTKTASNDSSSTVVPSAANTDSTQEVDPPTEDLNAKQIAAPEASPKPTDSNTANPTGEPQQNGDTTQEQTTTSKPTGFKPRFKAGLTKIDKKEE